MLQLSSVAKRWQNLLLRALDNDEESLKLVPIEPDYRLQLTNVPRLYSGEEIKLLESNRSFQLTTLPQRIDENYIALTSGACKIILYSRKEAFSLSDKKTVEKLSLTLSLKIKVWELTLESDVLLMMVKKDRNENLNNFEHPETTLLRKSQRALDIGDRASDKQSNIIAEAIAQSMITVIESYNETDNVEPKIKEEDEAEKLRSFLPRRHSTSSTQILGATALPILRHRGRAIPDVMESGVSFTTLFPNPPHQSNLHRVCRDYELRPELIVTGVPLVSRKKFWKW